MALLNAPEAELEDDPAPAFPAGEDRPDMSHLGWADESKATPSLQ